MSNSKKILSVLLSLILAFGSVAVVPLSVSAAEVEAAPTGATVDEAYPDFEYIIHCDTLDDGTAEITQYMGEGGDITIPSSLGGYTVTSIGWAGFRDCTYLTSVTIPGSVTSISDSAFSGCTGLTSIDIPDSVTSIGSSTFYGCTGLTSIDIHDSVTFIGDWAFGYCTSLTSIDIPDSVKWIGSDAFYGCTGLTSVTIGNSVTSIDDFAFYGCTGLTSVHISDIGAWCSIDFSSFGYASNNPLYYAHNLYLNDDLITELSIPDSVTSIKQRAFYGCTGLTSATIPDSVTSIGDDAFSGCTGLMSVTIPDSVMSIGDWAFYRCEGLTSITIPDSVTSIGEYAFGYYFDYTQHKVDDFTIYGYSGSEAERYANDNDFTFVPIKSTPDEATPDEATPDDAMPVSGTTGDCTWTLDNGVLTISGNGRMGEYEDEYNDQKGTNMTTAPWGSYSINSVVIQNGVTDIGSYAFDGLTELKSVTIGNSVTSIGVEAFRYCKGLTAIEIPGSVKSIDARAFYDCLGLTSIDIPNSVISIGNYAFSGCMRAKSITIPDSVRSIGEGAFTECAPIISVTIPGSVTSIGSKAFGYVYGSKKTDFIIYGYEGSKAEKYAKDNEFTFVPLKAKADEATGIILAVPENTDLTVKDITSEIICDLPDGCNKMTAYDISLTKDGETVQPENIVTIKIPCANENAKVYRFEADSTMTDMNAKYADGYMVFTTDHFSVYVLVEPKSAGVTVSGAITSYVDDSDVTIKLTGVDNNFTAEVTGKSEYSIADVPAGEYTLTVSKANHITREYTVTVADANVTQDVKLCPKGDVNGDGETDIMDCSVAQRYIRELTTLDAYQIACGDVSGEGDGELDIQDVSRILRHIRELAMLY